MTGDLFAGVPDAPQAGGPAHALLALLGSRRQAVAMRHVPSGRVRTVETQDVREEDRGWRVPIVFRDAAPPDGDIAWLAFAQGEAGFITLAECEDAVARAPAVAIEIKPG